MSIINIHSLVPNYRGFSQGLLARIKTALHKNWQGKRQKSSAIDCIIHPQSTERILREAAESDGAIDLIPAMLHHFEKVGEPEKHYLAYLKRLKTHVESADSPTIVLAYGYEMKGTEAWLTELRPAVSTIIVPTEFHDPAPKLDKLLVEEDRAGDSEFHNSSFAKSLMAQDPESGSEHARQKYLNWHIFSSVLKGLDVTTVNLMGEMFYVFPSSPQGCVYGASLWLQEFGFVAEIKEDLTYPNARLTLFDNREV